jgi:argininosuccinate synthase
MNKLCVLAYSGGLDTSFLVVWLKERGYDVATVAVETNAHKLGAVRHLTIDARAELWQDYLRYLLFGNTLRGQLYPLSVSAERVCQAKRVAQFAREIGAQAIAHGSTGAGNDQVRFDVAFRALAPDCEILAPVRSEALSREEELAALSGLDIQLPMRTSKYSVNEGMWGTSVGGAETHDSWMHLPESAYPGGIIDAHLPAVHRVIRFVQGVPVALDDQTLDPVALIEALNVLGRQYGVGRGIHLGDTILGIKGRVAFEAAAAHLLITAHRELEKLTLSGKQLFHKESLGNLYGALLHEGHYFDPFARDLEALLASSQQTVTGEVRLRLTPGQIFVEGVRSPHSLMQSKVASYGEGAKAWTGAEAAGYCKLFGIAQQVALAARAGN